MLLYWGRRGPITDLALSLARAASESRNQQVTISISRQNESLDAFAKIDGRLFPVATFASGLGAVTSAWRIPGLRRSLARYIREQQIESVVTLMPHIWGPFIAPVVRYAGAQYATIVHDADAHPGDATGLVTRWLLRDAEEADPVITLSRNVRSRLVAAHPRLAPRIETLFHPDLDFNGPTHMPAPKPGEPFRLLFLGRILPYKGLPLLVEAVERLREEGLTIQLGVHGEGPIGPLHARLVALNAEVRNRWLTRAEIAETLSRYHAVALSHVEASQSGVAMAALGGGLPVVATPVGGLPEQIEPGVTGVLAEAATPEAFAAALKKLALDLDSYARMRTAIVSLRAERSPARFLAELTAILARTRR
ncbi:glycosyltransferase family 4 protein [Terrarubrum flagellatum]|uniref:glycosyltransferase family 4 protein n=1 Tax=Terrirubrum flagellatum TaxID=2895980 RepID=UPI003144E824